MAAVCWRCIEDKYLQTIVHERGTLAECSLCECHEENTFGPEEFAEVLDPVMQEHFAQGPEVKKYGDDDSEWWEQEGDPLSHHIQEVIGQHLGFEDEIVDALEAHEKVRPQDGEEAFFDGSQDYVPVPVRPHQYVDAWSSVLDELKHRRRFFSRSAKALFVNLFEGVEQRRSGRDEKVGWEFPEGSEVYRARICRSAAIIEEIFSDPYTTVGPPPPELAREGRMNPEGVPVFYGSLDSDTCIAETRPALGDDTAVIKVVTTRALRLLDFSRLEESYSDLSYFQSDFINQCEKGAFLRRLQRLISEPIVPGIRQPIDV